MKMNMKTNTTTQRRKYQRRNPTKYEKLVSTQPTYGSWTIISKDVTRKRDTTGRQGLRYHVDVRCKCGVIRSARLDLLKSKRNSSCGACAGQAKSGPAHHHWKGVGDMPGTKYARMLAGAKKRNIECTITKRELYNVMKKQNRKCALSGEDLSDWDIASPDRIDSNKGYIPGNVQWVLPRLNMMKHTLTMTDFLSWCLKVVTHNGLVLDKKAGF